MKVSNWKGIPSKCALCFPEKGGRKFGNKIWANDFRWSISDLVEFLFPSHKMPIFHEVAVEYLQFLLDSVDNTDEGKKQFCQKTGYSLNTLRKNIVPKLYRFGLIHRTRELPKRGKWTIKSKRRGYERESLQFATMMRKMADEWGTMASTARANRQRQKNKLGDCEKEIQRQERLEWEKWDMNRALEY